MSSPAPAAFCSHDAHRRRVLLSSDLHSHKHRAANDSFLFTADIGTLLRFHLLHHICVCLASPTLTHQQPYVVASLASTSLAWPVLVSWARPLICFSRYSCLHAGCSSPCYVCLWSYTSAIQYIVSTKVVHH